MSTLAIVLALGASADCAQSAGSLSLEGIYKANWENSIKKALSLFGTNYDKLIPFLENYLKTTQSATRGDAEVLAWAKGLLDELKSGQANYQTLQEQIASDQQTIASDQEKMTEYVKIPQPHGGYIEVPKYNHAALEKEIHDRSDDITNTLQPQLDKISQEAKQQVGDLSSHLGTQAARLLSSGHSMLDNFSQVLKLSFCFLIGSVNN